MNILYLNIHDTGRYIGPYGYPVHTPNLGRLASEGVLFRHALCAAPTCSPSRAALLTGQYPHTNGMTGLAHRGHALVDYRRHLARTLASLGYTRVICGLQHVASDRAVIGYDVDLGDLERIPSAAGAVPAGNDGGEYLRLAESAAAYLHSFAEEKPASGEKRRDGNRFYLEVGMPKPHLYSGRPKDERYVRPPHGLPNTSQTREHTALFEAGVEAFDHAVGVILEALDSTGLTDNTLVICTTDHGISFPGFKCTLGDSGLGVFLIMRGPGGFTGGISYDAMVSHLDIYPTILELLGAEAGHRLDGVSLVPLVRGENDSLHEALFAEINYHAAYQPERCVHTSRYKYIRRFDRSTARILPNCDPSPSKSLLLEHGWAETPVAEERLYDLVFDPGEHRNLSGDSQYEQVRRELADKLEKWMRETDDPLLAGSVPPPPDAVTTDVHELDPDPRWRWKRIERGDH